MAVLDTPEFVDKLRAGDEQAFGQLIERYHVPLLRLARAFVSTPSVAEEVVQDTWLAVLTGLPGFEGRSSLKTWVFKILANRARTRGVKESRSTPFSSMAAGDEPAVDPSRFDNEGMWKDPPRSFDAVTPEKLALNKEAMNSVHAAMETLPAAQKAVLTLRDVAGLDADEVCTLLEISEANQRVLLHRARSKLRTVLEQQLAHS